MKYLSLVLANLISFFNPQMPLEERIADIQNSYGIAVEDQITVDHIHHIDGHNGWLAYYESGDIYICNDTTKDCDEAELVFILAHELYHHEQTLTIPTFEEDYREHSKYYEHEANQSAHDYVKESLGKNVSISEYN